MLQCMLVRSLSTCVSLFMHQQVSLMFFFGAVAHLALYIHVSVSAQIQVALVLQLHCTENAIVGGWMMEGGWVLDGGVATK